MPTARHSLMLTAAFFAYGMGVTAAFSDPVRVLSQTETTRIVADDKGEVEIPAAPMRVVSLHNIFTEALISFGMAPLGAVEHTNGLPSQLIESLGETVSVGLADAPDYEAILALEPDLILGQADLLSDNYELLSGIAPTLMVEEPGNDWREWFTALGAALGQGEAAQASIAAYDARAAEVREAVAAHHPDEAVLLLRVREKDIRVYGGARRAGPVLYTDLGLKPHALVDLAENHTTVSNEIIPELNADRIYLIVEDESKMTGIEGSALWQALPAVQAGHVHRVEIAPWNQSTGPISFTVILEDVAATMGVAE